MVVCRALAQTLFGFSMCSLLGVLTCSRVLLDVCEKSGVVLLPWGRRWKSTVGERLCSECVFTVLHWGTYA